MVGKINRVFQSIENSNMDNVTISYFDFLSKEESKKVSLLGKKKMSYGADTATVKFYTDGNSLYYFSRLLWTWYDKKDKKFYRKSGWCKISNLKIFWDKTFSFLDIKCALIIKMLEEIEVSQITEDILLEGLKMLWDFFKEKFSVK